MSREYRIRYRVFDSRSTDYLQNYQREIIGMKMKRLGIGLALLALVSITPAEPEALRL
jgi:hypothetical protein